MVTHVCNPNGENRHHTQLHSNFQASLGYTDTLSLNFGCEVLKNFPLPGRLQHVGHEFEASLGYTLSQ